ncbi:MAG: serine/threonine protein kinase [Acidobacteriaceae bacterium]|nr:serine/threonine protein kinase [Acidobacteriaceae bacterium]
MIPEVGQKFGPYEILDKLGSGAMGLVFRAWDARLHREVAVKLLHHDYDMPGMRERFLQEARAASALNHPNICTIFDLGEQDGEPYMVMELLEGETLKEKISRGAVPVDEILAYSQQVADALAAAHAKGIVHRDIKPANIFLVDQADGRKHAKVLDFGLAKIGLAMRGGRASRALDLTMAGATVGTLSYMSPEQARGQTLDERSDLFSLGVVMYEMATRQVPFQGATSALIFVQLLNHAPEPPHDWNDSIPKELEKIILKLLCKEKDARFQTATQLSQALRKIPFRSSGGWLKRAAAAVPLVKASDPVARGKRPLKTVSSPNPVVKGSGAAGFGAAPVAKPLVPIPAPVTAAPVRTSSEANMFIRPVVRSPQRDGTMRDEGVLRGGRPISNQGSLAVSAAPITAAPPTSEEVARTASSEQIPLRSRSGVTQFEFAEEMADAPTIVIPDGEAKVEASVGPVVEVATQPDSTTPATDSGGAHGNGVVRPAPVRAAGIKNRRVPAASPVTAAKVQQKVRTKLSLGWIVAAAGLLAVLAGGGLLFMNNGRFQPVLLKEGEPLLLTVIQNRTNEAALNGSVIEGLELVLEQSQYLTLRGGEAYRAGLKQAESEGATGGSVSSRKVAQLVEAKAYLYGEVTRSGEAYSIHLDVLKTDSNDKLTSIEEQAEGKDAIAAAIDRVARRIRADMGETDRAIDKTALPLGKAATADLDALQSYSAGETALQKGRTIEAITAFERSKVSDPKFTQAHLRLAWLYSFEHAETAAAAEAKLALDAAEGAGDRLLLLTQFCYEMNVNGDYARSAGILKQFRELFPHDSAGLLSQARLLRAQGHLPEALQAAQQTYSDDPYNGDAYVEAETALIGLDRFRSALQLQEQTARLGMVRNETSLTAAYLAGDRDTLELETHGLREVRAITNGTSTQESYERLASYGLSLDDKGRMAAGAAFWKAAAASAGSATGTASGLSTVQPYLVAQAALDRALAGSCGPALVFAHEAGQESAGLVASFKAGMAMGFCGDKAGSDSMAEELQQRFPQSSVVKGYYVADLKAIGALRQRDAKGGLLLLASAAAYDTFSLTPYLRGVAHMGSGEAALAVVDFQTVLDHRGSAFMAGSNVYPMAQIGLARAYASLGDKANSVAAYRRFSALWHDADRGQDLVQEALAKGR